VQDHGGRQPLLQELCGALSADGEVPGWAQGGEKNGGATQNKRRGEGSRSARRGGSVIIIISISGILSTVIVCILIITCL
jgi:hypothetical protein